MKPSLKIGSVLAASLLVTGCSAWPQAGNNGAFYTKVSSPIAAFQNDSSAEPLRYGQACVSGILGLYTTGDSTIATALADGSITTVVTIEEHFKHVLLGAYSQYCTVIGGY